MSDGSAVAPEVGYNEAQVVDVGNFKIRIPLSGYGEAVTSSLRRGGYEAEERSTLPKILKPGDRVLEVGGAIGVVSMVCADTIGQDNVVTYEANPSLVDNARANFALNGFSIRAKVGVLQNRVCWAGAGSSVPFYVHKDYWASSLADKPGTVETLNVQTFCFENEIRDFGANVLVCDIEGGEIDLLTLADMSGINKIMMEIHHWAGREGINKLMRKLIFDGFTVNFELTGNSIVCFHRGLLP